MIKKLPLLLSIVCAISLAGLTAYQSELIAGLKVDLSKAFQKLSKTEKALEAETVRVEELTAEIAVLKDSIALLNTRVLDLGAKIHGLKGTIANLNDSIRKKQDRVNALTIQIDKLQQEKNKAVEIARLQAERLKELDQMMLLDSQRQASIDEKTEKEKEKSKHSSKVFLLEERISNKERAEETIMEAPFPVQNWRVVDAGTDPQPAAPTTSAAPSIKTEDGNKIKTIVYDTKVNFQKVNVRNKENSNDLKKTKDDWKYVFFNINLENNNLNQLLGEEFILEIVDLDSGLLVPYNEFNPGYPESNQGNAGYKFVFSGNPLTVKYFNSQKKAGGNYEASLYYSRKGIVYPLTKGNIQFIRNNEVVTH